MSLQFISNIPWLISIAFSFLNQATQIRTDFEYHFSFEELRMVAPSF
jgi:hypothetical protein